MDKNITNKESGQMLVLSIIVAALVLVNGLMILAGSQTFFQNTTYTVASAQALQLAEAGADKALASFNTAGSSYSGESETALGAGSFSVAISSEGPDTKIITATGYVPSKTNAKAKRTISIKAARGAGISFNYGVQVGEGGLKMENSSEIEGSVFSNGSISMENSTRISGDAIVAGGTAPEADQQALCSGISCTDFIFGRFPNGPIDMAQSFKSAASGYLNKVALNLKKVGSPYDLTIRIMRDDGGKPDKNQVLATGILTSDRVGSDYSLPFIEIGFGSAPSLIADTTYWIVADAYQDSSNYWMWSADLSQGYTGGVSRWSPNWQAGNPVWDDTSPPVDLDFKTYMGGVATSIIGANTALITGDARANTLQDLSIGGEAYYQLQQNIKVGGSSCGSNPECHPGSPDPAPVPMPISEANINSWKDDAENAGTYTGDMIICNAVLTSGKYVGNISSNNGCTTIIMPPVWITGNLSLSNNVTYKLDPSMGGASGVILVDGRIILSNGAKIMGSGSTGSYLMVLSLYDSRESGLSAIDVSNGGNQGILYAPLGLADIKNTNSLNELTAWKVILRNNVEVGYETGLTSVFFSSGPTGSYSVIKGTYQLR